MGMIGKKRKRVNIAELPKKKKMCISKPQIKSASIKQQNEEKDCGMTPNTPPSMTQTVTANENEWTPEWHCSNCTFINTTDGYICSLCNNSDIQRQQSLNAVFNDKLLSTLQQRFGFHSFRLSQRDAINAALNQRDVVLIMPAGSSKSLCYQL